MSVGRRAFIQLCVGGTVGILFTPVPWKIADDVSIWTQNWGWIPTLKYGELIDKPAVSKVCDSGCAVKVRTVAGAPFGTRGNEGNVLSGGGICAACANGVQVMNSPNRVKTPMKKSGDGFEAISWDDALALLAEKVKAAGSKVAVISGDQSGTANEVFSGLLNGLGSDAFYAMPGDQQAADRAWTGLMGGSGQVGYDLEGADMILLAGADALESWGPTVANRKAIAGNEGSLYFAGPVQTRTAAAAKWVPVSSEGLAAFTLGICYYVLQTGRTVTAAGFDQFKATVTESFTPAKVEALTGVKADTLNDLANKLLAASKAVVVPGGSGIAAHAAAFALNLLLGGAMTVVPDFPKAVESAMSRSEMLKQDILKGVDTDVVLVFEANPAYMLPGQVKAGFTVAMDYTMNETTAAADLVLPTAHPYERYDDLQSPYGVAMPTYVASAPVIKSDLDVKNGADIALALAAAVGVDLGFAAFEEVLQAKAEAMGTSLDSLIEGEAFVSDKSASVSDLTLGDGVLSNAAAPEKGTGNVGLATYTQLNVGTANQATTPNAPCTITNSQLLGKSLVVMMNSETASKLGVGENSAVKLSGGSGECEALVHLYEGVLTDVVAAPLGLGHTEGDEFSKGKGDNVYKILTVNSEAAAGAVTWAGSTVNVAKL